MIKNYRQRALEILFPGELVKIGQLREEATTYGLAFIKGNWVPSPGTTSIPIGSLYLKVKGRVLHERVIYFEGATPMRSHQEAEQEVVKNIGTSRILYRRGNAPKAELGPGMSRFTFSGEHGLNHCFETLGEGPGFLYVAKALHPEYVEGDSFRMPENTYTSE